MYPWELTPGRVPELLNFHLPEVHRTRAEMIEAPVRQALADAGPGATAVDLACSEGWFSHRLLDWGAERVVGIDVRELNIRRAELVREHYGIEPERLELRQSDVLRLDPEELGTFDVVLLLGLVYHLEDPIGGVRVARALTSGLCLIESQLTRQTEPIRHGWGVPDVITEQEASFAGFVEPDVERNPIASSGKLMSLVPNRAALEQMALVAGFEQVDFLQAQPGQDPQYVTGDRAILTARP